jgi:tRNA G18 (ribose-2'-O)-methylase SpoU
LGIKPELIVDADDPRIADYVGLRDPELRISVEAAGKTPGAPHGRFIVEGALAVERLAGSHYPVRSVLVTEQRYEAVEPMLRRISGAVPRYVASQAILNAVAGFNLHRGVVASACRLAFPTDDDILRGANRALLVEGVVDHENLGSLFRNAAAFGVEAVVLDTTCADPLYRRCIRVSMGHVLRLPIARSPNFSLTVQSMQSSGWNVLALTPSPEATALGDLPTALSAPDERVAVLVGAEGPGLSSSALAAADRLTRIEMADGVDSLNVATAAAIVMHHLNRAEA